jgi:hypothetical protein
MRVWEVQESSFMPSDLVREQDFILHVRRMQRHPQPCLVLNLILNALPSIAKSRGLFEAVQQKLQEFAKASNGLYFEMSNGDVFMVWAENAETPKLANRIVESILPEHIADKAQFVLHYHMSRDYVLLRERTNHYVEVVRAAALGEGMGGVEESRGGLTAKNVDQIGQMLGEIDLRHYSRTQSIYRLTAPDWQQAGEEYFISFEDLRRERFPKLELIAAEHLFLALCEILDQRLLTLLTNAFEMIGGRTINLNLSVASIAGPVFAQFVRRVPRDQRARIGFELHRGDLFQDLSLTRNAIDVLKREGFRVVLDSVTPDMIPIVDLAGFGVDTIKIDVSKDRAKLLFDPKVRQAFDKLPPDRLIFFRCDNELALKAGRDIGVSLFQGWLIDDQAGGKK